MTISEEKYVASTTYRKSGTAVPTPTWIVALDEGRVGFWTSSASGKYKRLRNDPRILLQPSDARGRVKAGSRSVEGTAELVTSGADFDAIQRGIRAKYGVMVPVSRFFNTLGHIGKGQFPYGDVGVVITVSDPVWAIAGAASRIITAKRTQIAYWASAHRHLSGAPRGVVLRRIRGLINREGSGMSLGLISCLAS